jgi:hypothetical protein
MTINEAQLKIYGHPGRGLQKKISRAVAGGLIDVPYGANDPYTEEIAAVLNLDAHIMPKVMRYQISEPSPSPKPTPPPTEKRPQATAQDPNQGSKNAKQLVFENQVLFLFVLLLICLIDGVSMSAVAVRIIAETVQVQIGFFVAGAIVAYAGIQNAYTLSAKPRKNWENNPAGPWIVVFTIFQIVLHGAAGTFFGDVNTQVSQGLVAVAVPMATAAMSVLLFTPSKSPQA